MSIQHQRLPEPTLPEHELIRSADTLPELSPGLRSATLLGCQTNVLRARRLRRFKMTSIAAVVASAAFAVWSVFDTSSDSAPEAVAQETAEPAATGSGPSTLHSGPPMGSSISLGNADAISEQEMIDGTIEDVNRRTQKLIDAGIIPGF